VFAAVAHLVPPAKASGTDADNRARRIQVVGFRAGAIDPRTWDAFHIRCIVELLGSSPRLTHAI